MNKKLIRLNESDLHRIVKESVNRMLNEETGVRFNWNITVSPKYASKMYALKSKLENAKWVLNFECDEELSDTQNLSINPLDESRINEGGFRPLEWDATHKMYLPSENDEIDFDEMSLSELKTLRDKYLEQVGHTPMNKLANVRPDIFHALQSINNEIKDRYERRSEGDEYALV